MQNKLFVLISCLLLVTCFASSPAAVNLGNASNYIILAETAVTTSGTSHITGDIGLGVGDSTFFGFSQVMDASNQSSTSSKVTGKLYAANYASPTPTVIAKAISDMEAAYNDVSLRTPDFYNAGAEDISGRTFATGIYGWGGAVSTAAGSTVTLNGSATDIWIFQIAGAFSTGANSHILLIGGARPENVYWVNTGTATTFGANSIVNGNILSNGYITSGANVNFTGRILSKTAATLDGDTVQVPILPEVPVIPPTPSYGGGGYNPRYDTNSAQCDPTLVTCANLVSPALNNQSINSQSSTSNTTFGIDNSTLIAWWLPLLGICLIALYIYLISRPKGRKSRRR